MPIVQIGHYPEKRSGNRKGVEPESVETATFGDTPMAFIGSPNAARWSRVYDHERPGKARS